VVICSAVVDQLHAVVLMVYLPIFISWPSFSCTCLSSFARSREAEADQHDPDGRVAAVAPLVLPTRRPPVNASVPVLRLRIAAP